jgi:hypothetical protein
MCEGRDTLAAMSIGGVALASSCVYTIRRTQALERCLATDRSGSFVEKKSWTRASSLHTEAVLRGERVPIVFAPAEDSPDWGVNFCAIIADIEIDQGDTAVGKGPTTSYRFVELTRVHPVRPINELRKLSDGKPLSPDFIRPYALCQTPSYVEELLRPVVRPPAA